MKFSLLFILVVFSFFSCQSMRAKSSNAVSGKTEKMIKNSNESQKASLDQKTSTNKKSLYEELTGHRSLSVAATSRRILELARESKSQKDYVLALKRYNTLIVKYPKAIEVKDAYFDKAQLYKEMGLQEQSKYNFDLARKLTAQNTQKSKAKK